MNENKKVKSFPHFKDEGILVENKLEIANRFNIFFINIGPNLANNIEPPNNKDFKNYLKNRFQCRFRFSMVDESTIMRFRENGSKIKLWL